MRGVGDPKDNVSPGKGGKHQSCKSCHRWVDRQFSQSVDCACGSQGTGQTAACREKPRRRETKMQSTSMFGLVEQKDSNKKKNTNIVIINIVTQQLSSSTQISQACQILIRIRRLIVSSTKNNNTANALRCLEGRQHCRAQQFQR